MAVDPRQLVSLQETSVVQFDALKSKDKSATQVSKESSLELKPCWAKPVPKETEQSKGFITFSLTGGPEHHVSQVTDAVVVARYLGATLLLPDIRGSELGQKSFFPSINLKAKGKPKTDLDSTACLAMFGSLEMKQEILEVSDMMIERLKILSRNSGSQFIAVDLRVDVLEKKGCKEKGNGKKPCYTPMEIRDFLKKVGFNSGHTIYLTQTWWHESLNPLKEMFPKTYTKDDLIPAEKKAHFLQSGGAELQRALDFQICSKSDVFVPAIAGLFYGNVAGKRIASGRTQILVPSQVPSSSPIASSNFISTYVSKKNHLAYSCPSMLKNLESPECQKHQYMTLHGNFLELIHFVLWSIEILVSRRMAQTFLCDEDHVEMPEA
ncbi:hypothetical protein C4D60_Mb10t00560 [Musa balbisiana]|uniref:O-fucosyltransferase family protein n=1 Tax=Musa balbisiana TaxID=52838 RepID=A0A4S8ITN4_MUSBA|nr:hypothetical protein C4D60_Mb10t00560 [Musa balbisiana]